MLQKFSKEEKNNTWVLSLTEDFFCLKVLMK